METLRTQADLNQAAKVLPAADAIVDHRMLGAHLLARPASRCNVLAARYLMTTSARRVASGVPARLRPP